MNAFFSNLWLSQIKNHFLMSIQNLSFNATIISGKSGMVPKGSPIPQVI